jgi:hypothetical protein
LELGNLGVFGTDSAGVSTVAWAMASDLINPPRAVPIINCFDPELVPGSSWGPMVVDSTFHHFLNVNIEPLIKHPNPEYLSHWRSYLRNLISFLMPNEKVAATAADVKALIRKQVAVNEAIPQSAAEITKAKLQSIQQTVHNILKHQPLSHRLLLLNAKTQCSKTLCEDLAEELCGMPP